MGEKVMNDTEVALTSVVKQAARNFASVLAETPQFKFFQQVAERFRHDQTAQMARGITDGAPLVKAFRKG